MNYSTNRYSIFLLSIVLMFISLNVYSQSTITPLVNTEYSNVPEDISILAGNEYRSVIDLNGEWEIKAENSNEWFKILVPSSLDYQGRLLFRKKFNLPENISRYHIKLASQGIMYHCIIKLNGVYIGAHSGGYTYFEIDVFENVIKPGKENILEIEVDSNADSNTAPFVRPLPLGWKQYTGIIREIYLVLLPQISIADWKIDYNYSSDFTACSVVFTFLFQNFNQVSSQSLSGTSELKQENIQEIGYFIEIYNVNTNKLVKDNSASPKYLIIHQAVQDTLRFTFYNIQLWSPETPTLYRFKLSIIGRNKTIIDSYQSAFAFRHIAVRTDGFYLNGQKIKLKGIQRIEQHPNYGISLPYEIQKQDIKLIKDLGINIIRTGPYPNHPYVYDICDQMGIMVLEEIPAFQIPPEIIGRKEVIEHASGLLQEMINRDRRHPSIIGWGIGSELNVSAQKTLHFVQQLSNKARLLDKRLLYYSTNMLDDDNCNSFVDFRLIDLYSPDITQFKNAIDALIRVNLESPLVIGRIGSSVVPGNASGGYLDKTSLEHQAYYLGNILNIFNSNDRISGLFLWSFADWQGTVPSITEGRSLTQSTYHWGILTENREPRRAYQYLKSTFINNATLALTPGTIPDESQGKLIYIGFLIFIFLLILIKQHRWFGQNFRRSLIYPKIFFEDIIDNRNIQIWQTVVIGIIISASFGLGFASFYFFYKRNVFFDNIISSFLLSKTVKTIIIYLIWHPIANVIVITVGLMLIIGLLAFLQRYFLLLFNVRCTNTFVFNIIVWSGTSGIFVLPFSMAIYGSLQHTSLLIIYGVVLAFFLIWFILRFLIALRMLFRYNFLKVLVSFIVVCFLLSGGLALFFQSAYKSFTYAKLYISVVCSQTR